jgi:serine/threonine protein kinase
MKPAQNATAAYTASHRASIGESAGADDPRLASPLEEYLAALEAGRPLDRAAFLAKHPELRNKLVPLLDGLEFVHQVAPQLRSQAGDPAQRDADEPSPRKPASLGDYRILREVGRGGMGVVYEAEQLSLPRRVALKVLPFAAVMDPRRLARFRNEAQAAASLTHQHIVPVYGVGCERGVHYYAMQFIDGCTFAQVIEQLRPSARKLLTDSPASLADASDQLARRLTQSNQTGRPLCVNGQAPASSPPKRSWRPSETQRREQAAISTEHSHTSARYVRSVAELAMHVAEALDYAHSQGVIHRDIKPANLLLDMQGNPWITDFGLARVAADAGMTMTGDLLGTLRYMSPEQALAQRVVVDHRADIYSLGVTVYELLTLEPAFAASERAELLRDIAFREPTPPRRLQKALPADLETIVLKAIAKNPTERYATAQEMADDLRRYLGDQPIRARRPGILKRAHKWSRRHRSVVATAGVITVGALLVGSGLLWRERSQTVAAFAQARENLTLAQQNAREAKVQQQLADENFRQAQQAVERFYTQVSESKLLDVPNLAPVRQALLEDALQYYKAFVEQRRDDPLMQAKLATAHMRIAQIYATTGSPAWLDAYQASIDIVERLLAMGEDPNRWAGLNGGTWNYRGFLPPGPIDKSIAIQERYVETWQRLVEAAPGVAGIEHDLAGGHFALAAFQEVSGRNDDAVANYRQARLIWKSLVRRYPSELEYSRWFVRSCTVLSIELFELGRDVEGQEFLLEAVTGLHKFTVDDLLKNSDLLEAVDASYHALTGSLGAQGKYDEAEKKIRAALESSRKQFGENSWIVAVVLHTLAETMQKHGNHVEAHKACQQALAINRDVLGDESAQVADVLMTLGNFAGTRNDYKAAQKFYRNSLAIRRKVHGYEHPLVASSLKHLAFSLANQGKNEEAEEVKREAAAIDRKLRGDTATVDDPAKK